MKLVDPEGHELNLGPDAGLIGEVGILEIRARCGICRRVRCFMPEQGFPP